MAGNIGVLRLAVVGLVAVLLSWTATTAGVRAQDGNRQLVFVDFVVMSEGHDLTEREIYDDKATPIAARHGVTRFASLDIVQHILTPGLRPARLDLWLLPSVDALKAWGDDPEYQALLPYRNKIHDMGALTLYFAFPGAPIGEIGRGHYLVELQTMRADADPALFADYERESDSIAGPYAIRRVGVFSIAKKINGIGPDAQRLNIWYLPNEGNFRAWGENDAFKALAPTREALFDFSKYIMLLGRVE